MTESTAIVLIVLIVVAGGCFKAWVERDNHPSGGTELADLDDSEDL